MAIVKEVIESHDGTITVESKFGLGTKINIELKSLA